jgi:hypothetical protein
MKIIFFSQDAKLKSLAERLINVDWSFCDQVDELCFEYEQQPDDELWVYFLDFSESLKTVDQFSKKAFKNTEALRIGLIDEDDFKLIRKHQKTKFACHSYLIKPLVVQSMEEAIGEYLEAQGFELEGKGKFKLEFDTHMDVSELDEDKEDYDTTKSKLVLPDGLRTHSRATYIAENNTREIKSMDNQYDDEDDDEIFEAQEFKIHDDVKTLVEEHTNRNQHYHFESDPVSQKIQQKFSFVFGDAQEITLSQELMIEQESSTDNEIDLSPEDSSSVNQSLSINFNIDDDFPEPAMEPDVSKKDKNNVPVSQEEQFGDLDFSIPDVDLPIDKLDDATMTSTNESKDLGEGVDLSSDSDDELLFEATEKINISNAKVDKNQESADLEDDGLSFDLDDILESQEPKNENEVLESAEDDQDVLLDSIDEGTAEKDIKVDQSIEDDESQFDLSAAGSPVSEEADDEGFGDLNFSDVDEDDDVDPTVVGSIDTSSFSDSNSTSDKLEQTISEIVQGPSNKKNDPVDETGAFELDGDFSLSEDDLDSISQEVNSDKTAATIVINTSTDLKETSRDEETSGDFDLASLIEEESSTANFSVAQKDEGFSIAEADEIIATPKEEKRNTEPVKREEFTRPISSYNDDELLRLQSTIKSLREEREEHLRMISELKNEVKLQQSESLGIKAELDEARIEISIIKKRNQQEIEESRYQLSLAEEKKQIFEERCKLFQKEFDRLNQKVRLEFNQVKQREKELESQLELITMDSEAQVQARDNKILELKRKIDALEFNMENVTIREEKTREDKMKVEDKIAKIMTTLRGSIKILEEDAEIEEQLRVRLTDKQDK